MKIRVSWLTYFYVFIMVFGGYSKLMVSSFFLLCIHEFGHILMALSLKQKITQLTIYPFGISMNIDALDFSPSIYEGLIALAGPLTVYISYFILGLLSDFSIISNQQYHYLVMMNLNIFLFNMLPIYPLDGGRILSSILHVFWSFKTATILCLVFSFFSAFFLALFMDFTILYVYLAILVVSDALKIVNFKKYCREFHFYRYVHPIYTKSKRNKGRILFRNYTSYMVNLQCDERTYLRKLFKHHLDK